MMDTSPFGGPDFTAARDELVRLIQLEIGSIMRPPPRMTVPDWADEYRRLSTSVGAVGGKWQTHRVEIARGPMMAVTEPGVETITVMSCTQLMKTELMLNTLGYFAHLDPAPILLLEPKDEMATAFSKERITPMISSSPVLRDLMGGKKTRDSEDTIGFKKFPGGFVVMSGAGSPTNMAMRAIRVTLLDEVDKYETTKEGDPIELAEERTSTFVHSALHIRACSPTWEETSRIYASYKESDQRRPYVECPHCGHEQDLDFFRHVHWHKEGDEHFPETAAIYCESCGTAWSEAQRAKIMGTKGAIRYKQTRAFFCCGERQEPWNEKRWDWDEEHQVGYAVCKHCGERALPNTHAGFTASKLFSPFASVVALVKKWLDSRHDPEKKQTFYNTQLGQPFKADVQKEVSHHWLASRRENYPAEVPNGVLVLTAGVDVQAGGSANIGRLECEVVGWGLGEESWSIAAEVFTGDPAKPEVWAELDKFLLKRFKHERGFEMGILGACIDSGGHNANEVYAFCKARMGRNIWAIKGGSDRSGQWSPIWPPLEKERKKKWRAGYRAVILGVNSGKESIRQKLLVEEPGPSYCHFPTERTESWFEQLTSEELSVEKKAGVSIRKWTLKHGRKNEALDARVYSYAALKGLEHTRKFRLENAALEIDAYVMRIAGREVVVMDGQEEPRPPPVPTRKRGGVRRSTFLQDV